METGIFLKCCAGKRWDSITINPNREFGRCKAIYSEEISKLEFKEAENAETVSRYIW